MKNLIFLIFIFLTAGCTKSDLDVEVKGQVFQCCNIWEDFVSTDNIPAEAVADFLNDNDIPFTDINTVDNGFAAVCITCCQCPEGMEVKFKVSEEDLEAVLALKFEEN